MPIYEFKCKEDRCQRITSEILDISNKKKEGKCQYCSGKTKRILSAPGGFDIKGYSAKNGYSKGEK